MASELARLQELDVKSDNKIQEQFRELILRYLRVFPECRPYDRLAKNSTSSGICAYHTKCVFFAEHYLIQLFGGWISTIAVSMMRIMPNKA